MIFKCTRCKKKFHKKPDRVPMIKTKPYCSDCYEYKTYFDRLKRNLESELKKKNKLKLMKGGKI